MPDTPITTPDDVREWKCVVAAKNAAGLPDFCFCIVRCRIEQYEEGDHATAASEWATERDYEPKLVYDEIDMGGSLEWLRNIFNWGSAPLVDISKEPIKQIT